MTPEIRAFLEHPSALIITKANVKSRVHRRVHLDYIGIKLFNETGQLNGELRLIGLFTANLYTNVTSAIPYLRKKVASVVDRAGFDASSYAGRALAVVLESYPRDELFQVDSDTLYHFAISIMNLSERPRLRALARPDEFDRFISVLVYIPKDRYDTTIRRRVGEFLAQTYQGRVSAAYPSYPEGPLARTHFIIGRDEGKTPQIDQEALEQGIAAIVRTWSDGLRSSLEARQGGAGARALLARYGEAFSAAYREAFSADEATRDIDILERLSQDQPHAIDFYHRDADPDTRGNLRLFSLGAALPLSLRVPLLEDLGFRVVNERTYRISLTAPAGGGRVWLHDMTLERASGATIDIAATHAPVEETLLALFNGMAESDGFNQLVLAARLRWRDVAIVRAMARYLRQIQVPYGEQYLAATLARHAQIAARIVALFHARFDPRAHTDDRASVERGSVQRSKPRSRMSKVWMTIASCVASPIWWKRPCARTTSNSVRTACRAARSLSNSPAAWSMRCPRRGRCTRSSSTARVWRACICALARWREAACAGLTGRRTTAPRYSAWRRRSRSRMR